MSLATAASCSTCLVSLAYSGDGFRVTTMLTASPRAPDNPDPSRRVNLDSLKRNHQH